MLLIGLPGFAIHFNVISSDQEKTGGIRTGIPTSKSINKCGGRL